MCGIAGSISDSFSSSEEMVNVCRMMTNSLEHRGPDNCSIWHDYSNGISLGHQRLSILDLSENGHQPMHSKSNRYVIVYNGEIYNHLALRDEISNENNFWIGTSDTETLLAAIELWGIEEALSKLVGMFAFVLWDKVDRKVFLARDRMGEKPLYYRLTSNSLIFASELKSLKYFPSLNHEINLDALSMLFRYAYIPSPYTIYNETYKLPQGTYLVLDAHKSSDGKLSLNTQKTITPYWSLNEKVRSARLKMHDGSFVEARDNTRNLLEDSVKMQMISDVPIGSFLSGGIDSSIITAIMQSFSTSPIKTYSIGFQESEYDEAIYSKKIAKYLGTDHTELYLSERDIIETITKLPSVFDEPFADSSQIPTYLVSSLAASEVKVALTGDGGDELFGGYNRYIYGQRIANIPYFMRAISSKMIKSVSPATWQTLYKFFLSRIPIFRDQTNFGDKFHKLAQAMEACTRKDLYRILISNWRKTSPLSKNHHIEGHEINLDDWSDDFDFQQNMMNSDLKNYLPDDILVKIDRTAMSHSLEGRVPFLDHRLVEYSLRLPLSMKINKKGGKLILKSLLKDYMPENLFERKKRGFAIPIESLIRGPLRDWSENLLDKKRIIDEGYLDENIIRSRWEEHLSGARNWQYQLWIVLMFQSWLEENK